MRSKHRFLENSSDYNCGDQVNEMGLAAGVWDPTGVSETGEAASRKQRSIEIMVGRVATLAIRGFDTLGVMARDWVEKLEALDATGLEKGTMDKRLKEESLKPLEAFEEAEDDEEGDEEPCGE